MATTNGRLFIQRSDMVFVQGEGSGGAANARCFTTLDGASSAR